MPRGVHPNIETQQHDHVRHTLRYGNRSFGFTIDVCLGCGLVSDDMEILSAGLTNGTDSYKMGEFEDAIRQGEGSFRHVLRAFYEVEDEAPN